MGLDGVELVMDIEDKFQITIKDDEATGLRTVGDMVAFVQYKVMPHAREGCLTARTFYKLRKGISMRGVKPTTPMEEVLPPEARMTQWPELAAVTGLDLPILTRSPDTAKRIVALSFAAAFLTGVAIFASTHAIEAAGVISLLALGISAAMLLGVTRNHVYYLPDAHTFGDFTRQVLNRNFGIIANETNSFRTRELREAVHRVIADCLKIDAAQLTDDMRFIEDLNLG